MTGKFDDPMERLFIDKFGIDTFAYVQKLIQDVGYTSKEAYVDLGIQMDIIRNDLKHGNMTEYMEVHYSARNGFKEKALEIDNRTTDIISSCKKVKPFLTVRNYIMHLIPFLSMVNDTR